MSYVIKSADQTKTSDITAAVDSELVLALASGATYYVDALVMFRTGVTPAIKIGIGSTAATGLCCIYTEGCASRQPYQNASTSYSAVQSARLTSAGTYALGGSATGSDRGWFRLWVYSLLQAQETSAYIGPRTYLTWATLRSWRVPGLDWKDWRDYLLHNQAGRRIQNG